MKSSYLGFTEELFVCLFVCFSSEFFQIGCLEQLIKIQLKKFKTSSLGTCVKQDLMQICKISNAAKFPSCRPHTRNGRHLRNPKIREMYGSQSTNA